MKKKRRGSGLNAGTISIMFIVLIFVTVMGIQIYKLKQKDAYLSEIEENRKEQLGQEIDRAEELKKLDWLTKTEEFIKELANKMGLVLENEIIFKENDE